MLCLALIKILYISRSTSNVGKSRPQSVRDQTTFSYLTDLTETGILSKNMRTRTTKRAAEAVVQKEKIISLNLRAVARER